jgi:hypothetical protein
MKTWGTVLLCIAAATSFLTLVGALVSGLVLGYLNARDSRPEPPTRYVHRDRSPDPLPLPTSAPSTEASLTDL